MHVCAVAYVHASRGLAVVVQAGPSCVSRRHTAAAAAPVMRVYSGVVRPPDRSSNDTRSPTSPTRVPTRSRPPASSQPPQNTVRSLDHAAAWPADPGVTTSNHHHLWDSRKSSSGTVGTPPPITVVWTPRQNFSAIRPTDMHAAHTTCGDTNTPNSCLCLSLSVP